MEHGQTINRDKPLGTDSRFYSFIITIHVSLKAPSDMRLYKEIGIDLLISSTLRS